MRPVRGLTNFYVEFFGTLVVGANLVELDQEIRDCVLCADILGNHPENPPDFSSGVKPKPILSKPISAHIMLIGQAPGLTEYRTGSPFSGPAGEAIRRFFSECGLPAGTFDQIVYQTSAVKCFPGRKRNKDRWEDRQPCAIMTRSCSSFLERQIKIIDPKLIITMGSVATAALDKLRSMPRRTLSEAMGKSETWDGTALVHLAHTSGASRFLNNPVNRAKQELAKAALRSELARLGLN